MTARWTVPEPPAGPRLIVSASEYRRSVPAFVPWVVAGLLYIGGVLLVSGPPKAGKSTLLAELQRSRWTGDPFLGAWSVVPGPVLLVTEESGIAVVMKLLGDADVLDRRTAIEMGYTAFGDVLLAIREWAHVYPRGVVIIDTLAVWAGLADENDAGAVTQAVAAVTALAAKTGIAIVLLHHTRKGGGQAGEAIRGSSAILATVDVSAELSYTDAGPTSPRRWLEVRGRVMEPSRHLMEFGPTPGRPLSRRHYRLVDPAEAAEERDANLVAAIPPAGATLADLIDRWGVSDKTARRRVADLVASGVLEVDVIDGRGTKRYATPDGGHDHGPTNVPVRRWAAPPKAPLHPGHPGSRPKGDQGGSDEWETRIGDHGERYSWRRDGSVR
jgi:hypothetical protein